LAVALTVAVIPAFAVPYGGEIVFRVYLFALPFLAFFAAALLFATRRHIPSVLRVVGGVAGAAMAVLFIFANDGKDRQYVADPSEIETVRWLLATAPAGSLLIEGNRNYPSQFLNYENLSYVSIENEPMPGRARLLADPLPALMDWMRNRQYSAAYVLLTRSMVAHNDDIRVVPPGTLSRLEEAIRASPHFRLARGSRDAEVFELIR
jgi:hypothetical protein